MSDDLTDEIRESAQGPAEARGDLGSMRQHRLADLVEAARYLAGREIIDDPTGQKLGFRIVQLRAPGAV